MTRWPAIPRTVRGAGGPIRVRQIQRVRTDDNEAAWGTWELGTRIIRLDRNAPSEMKWRTFYHELAHAALDDAGISNLFSADGNETLCDAMASARMQELRGHLKLTD
jgi:Zn-dependent peptidase ImmA (M78 family)